MNINYFVSNEIWVELFYLIWMKCIASILRIIEFWTWEMDWVWLWNWSSCWEKFLEVLFTDIWRAGFPKYRQNPVIIFIKFAKKENGPKVLTSF